MTGDALALVAPSIESLRELQAAVASVDQVELKLFHHFTDGAYLRELHVPAGVMLVGKMHRTRHALIVVGDVTIVNGKARERITGFRVLQTEPGTKRAIVAHADSVLTTVHVTNSRDLEEIERAIIVPDDQELSYVRQLAGGGS